MAREIGFSGASGLAGGPDFLCVGAQKGGTRWLFDQLQFHPDFWMPPIKELHYFDGGGRQALLRAERLLALGRADLQALNSRRLAAQQRALDERDLRFCARVIKSRPKRDLESYARLFEEKGSAISGDVTPAYSKLSPLQIERIIRRFPSLRVVFLARDPIERFWSQVAMRARADRVVGVPDKDRIVALASSRVFASRSHPSAIVTRWRQALPDGQFGLYFFEHLKSDPIGLRRQILMFLGADPSRSSRDLPADFNRKSSERKMPMQPSVKTELRKIFAQELLDCARILGGPAEEWPRKYDV